MNAADKLGLVDPEQLAAEVEITAAGRMASRRSRRQLDRQTFSLTDSELERGSCG